MTQGGNDPLNPPSSPSTASLSGVARCWHSNAYFSLFFAIFLRPTEQICPDSAGPFTRPGRAHYRSERCPGSLIGAETGHFAPHYVRRSEIMRGRSGSNPPSDRINRAL